MASIEQSIEATWEEVAIILQLRGVEQATRTKCLAQWDRGRDPAGAIGKHLPAALVSLALELEKKADRGRERSCPRSQVPGEDVQPPRERTQNKTFSVAGAGSCEDPPIWPFLPVRAAGTGMGH